MRLETLRLTLTGIVNSVLVLFRGRGKSIAWLWIVCLSIVVQWGCNREPTTAPAPTSATEMIQRIGFIAVSSPTQRFGVGDSIQLRAVVFSETNKVMEGQSVRWISSDPSTVRVSERGVAYGERIGSATITASVGDKFATVSLSVSPGACRQASATIEIGQSRTGVLSSSADCLLVSEPAQGWQFSVTAPALVQIDLATNLYFAHFALTDIQLRPIDQARNTLRKQLSAGTYIVWVAADSDDGEYALSIKAVEP